MTIGPPDRECSDADCWCVTGFRAPHGQVLHMDPGTVRALKLGDAVDVGTVIAIDRGTNVIVASRNASGLDCLAACGLREIAVSQREASILRVAGARGAEELDS